MGTPRPILSFCRAHSVGITALTIGVVLIVVAAQRSISAYQALPASVAIFQLEQGKQLTSQHLATVEEELASALGYGVNQAELNNQLSYISLRRLLMDQPPAEAKEKLQQTLNSVEAALKLRPLDAYLWTRYTHISYMLNGLSPYTLAALDRSFRYGSKEKQLFQFRMVLCLTEWERLPPALKEATVKQIEFGASHPTIWGYVLADLSVGAREILLGFLTTSEANVKRALNIERLVRRARETN